MFWGSILLPLLSSLMSSLGSSMPILLLKPSILLSFVGVVLNVVFDVILNVFLDVALIVVPLHPCGYLMGIQSSSELGTAQTSLFLI